MSFVQRRKFLCSACCQPDPSRLTAAFANATTLAPLELQRIGAAILRRSPPALPRLRIPLDRGELWTETASKSSSAQSLLPGIVTVRTIGGVSAICTRR